MAHTQEVIADEKYDFKSATRSKLFMLFGAGLLLFIIGVFMARSGGGHGAAPEHGEKKEHASAQISDKLVASADQDHAEHEAKTEAKSEGGEHHGSPVWLKRIYA